MTVRTNRQALQVVALRLFRERGYESVSVKQIAAAAGVSHMTFFRHFATKEAVVVADLFDPAMAHAVAAQEPSLSPLERAVGGLLEVMTTAEARQELGSDEFRDRIRLVADTPSLRGAVWSSSAATEAALCEALSSSGSPQNAARAAAGATMGAATAILLEWASSPSPGDAAETLSAGLASLIGTRA